MSVANAHKPWYREHWPWLLMLPPGASVIAGFTLLYFAVTEPSALVVDDYSRIEEISREEAIEDRRAAERGLTATLRLRADDRGMTQVTVEVAGTIDNPRPTLVLRLRHAGNPAADRTLVLDFDGREYAGRTDLSVGRYDFELRPSDGAWRLSGAIGRAPTTVHVTATPPPE